MPENMIACERHGIFQASENRGYYIRTTRLNFSSFPEPDNIFLSVSGYLKTMTGMPIFDVFSFWGLYKVRITGYRSR